LKEAKYTYIEAKKDHQSYRDKYVLESIKHSKLKCLQANEKEKQQ